MARARSVSRRQLLATSGALGALGLSSCTRTTTNPDVQRDPLPSIASELYDGSTAKDMLAANINSDHMDHEIWGKHKMSKENTQDARERMAALIDTCYLNLEAFRELPESKWQDHILAKTPEAWKDDLTKNFREGARFNRVTALPDHLKFVGNPFLTADWYLTERFNKASKKTPAVAAGGTIAWSVLDPSTNIVAPMALRYGFYVNVEENGRISEGTFIIGKAGVDLCETTRTLLRIPAIKDNPQHQQARDDTMAFVIKKPRIAFEDATDPYSGVFKEDSLYNPDLCD